MKLVEISTTTVLLSVLAGSLPCCAQTTASTSTEERIQQLEQKIEELDQRQKVSDRLREIKSDEDADKAKSAASVTANGGPFTIRSGDGDFVLRLGADFQIDNRNFPDSGVPLTDQILIRRARPTISGTIYKNVDFYVRPDFGQGQVVLYEAYVQLNYFSRFNLRVGKFKPPVGLERLQSDDDTNFIERGLPTLLVPSRDIGYQLSGDIVKRRVSYAVGVFDGVPDNSLGDNGATSHRDYDARIFLTPFQSETKNPLSGLGVGIGATSGSVDGLALPAYKTFGQNTFVTFASGVTSAGHRARLAPQAYYYLGPVGVVTEYTLSKEGFQKGTVQHEIDLRSWQVQASFLLTGEKKVFGTLVPKKAFDPKNHGWGALEVEARVGDFSIDKGLYDYGFASPATSPRRAHEWVGGASWYLNRMVRVSLDYGSTTFEGGAPLASGGNRPAEHVVLDRFQVNF